MNLTTKRALRVVHRTVGAVLPPTLLSKRYPGVPGRIHIDDQMLTSDSDAHVRHYIEDAQSALENLSATLMSSGTAWENITACLDLPSGYGRVTRWLARCLPPSHITAADVDARAVRFCASEFGVRPLVTPTDLSVLRLPQRYDLIFTGSLLTHLPPDAGYALLDNLVDTLIPGGHLVFSTQGESCLSHLDMYGPHFVRKAVHFTHRMAEDGVAYLDYPSHRGYGITLHAVSTMRRRLTETLRDRVELVRYAERGWDRHQDVWSVRRR